MAAPARVSKPSSVLDGHLSRDPCGPRVPRRLGTGSRLSPDSASSRLMRAGRRLLQGGLPFSLHAPKAVVLVSVALVRPGCPVGTPIWTVRPGACPGPSPAYARHPAVRSSDFPLPLTEQRPSYSHRRVLAPHAPPHYTESLMICQGDQQIDISTIECYK